MEALSEIMSQLVKLCISLKLIGHSIDKSANSIGPVTGFAASSRIKCLDDLIPKIIGWRIQVEKTWRNIKRI